jgi:glycosyltransferase involved in cell wall biosynthesis
MIGLKETEDFGYPSQFSENRGYPIETLNMLYNASNALLATSLGEGFGLPYFEAMATKTINVAPDNTTVPELFNITKGDGPELLKDDKYIKKIRGIPVKSGSNDTEWFSLGSIDKERFRPLTNVEDMVKKLIWVYDNPSKVKQIEEQAHKWVQGYTWDIIAKQWEDLFIEIFDELQASRRTWVPPKGYVEGDLPQSVKIKVGEEDENVETPHIKKD